MQPNGKTKILFYGDSPTCATGFATVSRNILLGLYNTGKYDIDIFGVNYWGDPKPPLTQMFNIYPAGMNNERDPYGREKFKAFALQMDFDILFFLQDSFILTFIKDLIPRLKAAGKKFVSVCYYPCDSIIKPEWADAVCTVDYPVAYTKFAKEQTNRPYKDIRVIYHGVDPDSFFPLPEKDVNEFKSTYFGAQKDKYIFLNVNRNQQRKDIPRFMRAVKIVKDTHPDCLAYSHCAIQDQGWNMEGVCNTLGMNPKKDALFPVNFSPNQGYPIHILNLIYNASSAVVSTDLGEGTGLSSLEGMAARKPVIIPNNTVRPELFNDDVAYLVDSGSNENLWTILPNDNEVLRPLVDINDLVRVLKHVMDNPEEAKEKAEAAYNYVSDNFFWEKSIVPQWVDLFDELTCKLNTYSLNTKVSSTESIMV